MQNFAEVHLEFVARDERIFDFGIIIRSIYNMIFVEILSYNKSRKDDEINRDPIGWAIDELQLKNLISSPFII